MCSANSALRVTIKMKKNKVLSKSELDKFADISEVDIQDAIRTANPKIKPFLEAETK